MLNGLEFPDKTVTLKPGKSLKLDIATPNYKVGKYRFVQHFKDENGKEYVLAAPFEIVWPSLKMFSDSLIKGKKHLPAMR